MAMVWDIVCVSIFNTIHFEDDVNFGPSNICVFNMTYIFDQIATQIYRLTSC